MAFTPIPLPTAQASQPAQLGQSPQSSGFTPISFGQSRAALASSNQQLIQSFQNPGAMPQGNASPWQTPSTGYQQNTTGNTLPGAIGNFAQEVAAAIGAGAATSNFSQMNSQQAQNLQTAITERNKLRAQGVDTSKADAMIVEQLSGMGQTGSAAQVLPAVNDTPEQVAGNALGVATDIASAGVPDAAAEAPAQGLWQGIKQGVLSGAKLGGLFGAAQGTSAGMQGKGNVGQVIGSAAQGGVAGAAGGAVLGGAIGGATSETPGNFGSALKDVTPNYDDLTPTEKQSMTSRTQEGGVFSGRKIVPNNMDINTASALAEAPGYSPSNTKLVNAQAALSEIGNQAQTMRNDVAVAGTIIPKTEVAAKVSQAMEDVSNQSLLLQASDPTIKQYTRVMNAALDQNPGTAEGLLDVRQTLDDSYENARGKLAFNSDKISALDDVHTAARDTINDLLKQYAPNANVEASMQNQMYLYKAYDALNEQASNEAGSGVARLMQSLQGNIAGRALIKGAAGAAGAIGVGATALEGAHILGIPLPGESSNQ